MSQKAMQALLNIVDWYASPIGTFIKMFSREKPLDVLPMFAMDKLIMQEDAYHISTGLSIGLHRRKKAPLPSLPLRIRLHEIQSYKTTQEEEGTIAFSSFAD